MAWTPLPTNLTNATAQQDLHPAVHNSAHQAINDLVVEVDATSSTVDDLVYEAHRPRSWFAQGPHYSGPYGTTPTPIAGLSVDVTFEYGKSYRITAHVSNVRAIDQTRANLRILVAGAILQTCNQIMPADSDTTMESSVLYAGNGTTATVTATMDSTATTMAAIFIDGDATHWQYLLVEEIGTS